MLHKIKFSTNYTKGAISLFKGSFWAQLIGFFGTFFIAKLYGPDSLGVFSKFISLSSVFAIFFTLRLEPAFVLTKNENNLKAIFSSIVYSIFISSFFSVILISVVPNSFFLKINFLKIYTIFCVLGAFLKSLENTYLSYLLRQKKFKNIALSRVLFTSIRYIFQLSLFYILPTKGLIIGFVFASLFLVFFYYYKSGTLFLRIPFSKFKEILQDNINLVSYGVVSDNLNAINLHIIPIIAGIYFSDTEIGWYFLAYTLLSVPISFINASVSKIFFLRASEIYNQKTTEIYSFVKKFTLQLTLGLLIPFLFIFLCSKVAIAFFLPEKWNRVTIYIQLLSVLFYIRAIYNPISHIEEVLKKNHVGLFFNIFLFLGNLTAIYLGFKEQRFLVTIKVLSFILPFGYVVMIVYFLRTTYQLRFKKTH
jgi:O-antigen/teichoic acid export membrane protein